MEDLVRKSERVEAQVDDGLKFDFDDDLAQLESKPKNSKIASAQASSTDGEKSIREANRDKLQALDMKRNEMRAKAKEAREDEAKRVVAGPESEKKSERQMQRERGHEFEENLKEKGVDPERYRRMNQTQETLESKGRKDKRKREGDTPDTLGLEVYAKSYEKRQKAVDFKREDYEAQKERKGDSFFAGSDATVLHADYDAKKVDRLVDELKEQEERRRNYSRRRTYNEDEDVSFINESNRNFVKKIGRAYDKYTTEIAESLERGTAL